MTPQRGSTGPPGPTDPLARLLADPPELPVAAGLDRLAAALEQAGAAVVQAPPGSGKTTLVPPAVALGLGPGAGRVVVTQPRRIAARAAARRLASLLGEPVGETIGYAVRGQRRTSAATRVEVVTTGLLVRRLQQAPDLPGVGAVVLDEVHERSLDADLALALLVDVRSALREDLRLVAMSATLEAERFSTLLGAPVIDVPGALHPVAVEWSPAPSGVHWLDDRGVTRGYLDHVAATVRRALSHPGDVLVFLPGAREVDEVARRLGGSGGLEHDGRPVAVRPLHGRLPAAEQDAALRPGGAAGAGERRVVVATAVAESSLTVPGVRVVVDAGLSREPRTDHRRGLAGLVTVRVSRAAAEQRAGRAGREAAGVVLRCWSESEHAHLAAHPRPEIAAADLTGLALELAAWGVRDDTALAALALPDQPPAAAMASARATLADLGALDDAGPGAALTARGRSMVGVPTDPRLARALLDGAALVGPRRAAEVVALLADDVRAPGGDLVAALRAARRGEVPGWRASVGRLLGSVPGARDRARDRAGDRAGDLTDDLAVGAVVALAHPDRVARRRSPDGREASYLMVGGTGVELPGTAASLAGLSWLAVADVERRPGRSDALVRSAAPLSEDLALEAAASRRHEVEEVAWTGGRVTGRRVTRLGAIELASVPVSRPDPDAVRRALADGLRREGLGALRWSEAATGLRRRLAFLHRTLGEPWPDVSDEALLAGLETWLDLSPRGAARSDPRRADVLAGLRGLLPWPEATRLDELAPERLAVPSGQTAAVDYELDQPVLAVKLQELFGLAESPRLADGRVPVLLHLLSPAGRPLAVTADLGSFWRQGYPGVRGEMRGRYPRHPWPEDPWTAPATARTKQRG